MGILWSMRRVSGFNIANCRLPIADFKAARLVSKFGNRQLKAFTPRAADARI
jgi:hypothetical protein